MEYTIKKLAQLAGISTRTLRYYDEIGLLKPCRINSSGYRIYGENEVNLLQQIMIYKYLNIELENIKQIIYNPNFDIYESLKQHRYSLIKKREEIDNLILNVDKTIKNIKGEIEMTNKEKFEGFKKKSIEDNEKIYGKEIREKYGDKVVNESNSKFLNMSEKDFENMNKIEQDMFNKLKYIMKSNDLESNEAKQIYDNHKKWLSYSWNNYTKEAHIGLAEMYVYDERFTVYYDDKIGEGASKLLRDIIIKYAK